MEYIRSKKEGRTRTHEKSIDQTKLAKPVFKPFGVIVLILIG